MIFIAGSCVVGDNGTAYETLVSNNKFERTTAISAANVIVDIFCLCSVLIIYVSTIYRHYSLCDRLGHIIIAAHC